MVNSEGKPGVVIYFDVVNALKMLDYPEKGRLFEAIMEYGQNGTVPKFDNGMLTMAWAFVQPALDRDSLSYKATSLARQRAAHGKWWKVYAEENGLDVNDVELKNAYIDRRIGELSEIREKCNSTQTMQMHQEDANDANSNKNPSPSRTPSPAQTDIEGCKPHKKTFVPPTVEEVAEYVRQRGSKVDPRVFIDFYAAKGWLVGKVPMRDWKAACRNAESWERWEKKVDERNRVKTAADYESGESFV